MPAESQARVDARARAMLADMPLEALLRARSLSQKMLADVLDVQPRAIAKMEKCADKYVSTLRSHIEAMGGQLEVVARFPEGTVEVNSFADLGEETGDPESLA